MSSKQEKQAKKDKDIKYIIGCCNAFMEELEAGVNDAEDYKEFEFKTAGNVRESFNKCFKDYYKSKKSGLLSRTIRVLKGMDKGLKKIEKKKFCEENSNTFKAPFVYTVKDKDSTIDNKDVFDTFSKIKNFMDVICNKAKELKKAEETIEEEEKANPSSKANSKDAQALRKKRENIAKEAEEASEEIAGTAGGFFEEVEDKEAEIKQLEQEIKKKGMKEKLKGFLGIKKGAKKLSDEIRKLHEKVKSLDKEVGRETALCNLKDKDGKRNKDAYTDEELPEVEKKIKKKLKEMDKLNKKIKKLGSELRKINIEKRLNDMKNYK